MGRYGISLIHPMGITTRTGRTPFGNWLRGELDRREWGVRTLAREMANRANKPERIESIRRQLKTYLTETSPATPETASRNAIEDALEVERGTAPGDDEEPDPPLRVTFPVTIDLPQELVDRAVEKHMQDKADRELETA